MGRLIVSIVTPCLNPGHRLKRCIDSVRSQSYPDIEHIVVDGASHDGTLDLLRGEPSVKWISEKDHGQSEAINKGFRMATGQLMGWLNADDTLAEGSIEASVRAFTSDSSLGWTYGNCLIVQGESSFVLTPPTELRLESFDSGNVVPQPGTLFSRDALNATGPLDPSMHLAMDFDLFLRLLIEGNRAKYIDKVLAMFEIHGESKNGTVEPIEFMRDELRALIKGGRIEAALAHMARIAVAAADDGKRVHADPLMRQVRRLVDESASVFDMTSALASARTEAAMVESQRSVLGLRHLLNASVWKTKSSRQRIMRALARGAKDPSIRPSIRYGRPNAN